MKKFTALLLVFIMTLSLVACGGNNTTDSGNNDNPSQVQTGDNKDNKDSKDNKNVKTANSINFKEMNEENWSEMLKKLIGIELSLPEGWKTTELFPYGFKDDGVDTQGDIELKFSPDGDVKPADFGTTVFEAIEKIADKNGIFDQNARKKNSYDEAFKTMMAVMCANLEDGRGIRFDYYPSDYMVSLKINIDNYPHILD